MKPNTLIPQLLFPLQSYVLDCQARGLRKRTIDFYHEGCNWFLEFAQEHGALRIEDITAPIVRAYLVNLQNRGWRSTSIGSQFRSLRGFFNFLVRDEVIDKSPLRKIIPPKEEKLYKGIYTADEIKKLLAAAVSLRDKALILFLLDTGARISEALAVNVDDIDIATGRVHLHETKDREPRFVYLGVQARRQLIKYLQTLDIAVGAPLWIDGRSKQRLLRNGATQLLMRLGKKAGVKPCGAHRFRRTFAVNFLRNGGDIFILQRILGHSTLEMVRKYLDGLDDDDAQEAHRKYAPGDRMG